MQRPTDTSPSIQSTPTILRSLISFSSTSTRLLRFIIPFTHSDVHLYYYLLYLLYLLRSMSYLCVCCLYLRIGELDCVQVASLHSDQPGRWIQFAPPTTSVSTLSPESYASEHQHYDEDSSNEAASGSYTTNFSASQGTAARRIGTNVSPREGILSPFAYESG